MWKLCQGIANLSINEQNKVWKCPPTHLSSDLDVSVQNQSSNDRHLVHTIPLAHTPQALVVRNDGVRLLAEVLFGKHHNNEAAQRHALSALWNLAFDEQVGGRGGKGRRGMR